MRNRLEMLRLWNHLAMMVRAMTCLAIIVSIEDVTTMAQEEPAVPVYFEQHVKDSNPLPTEPAKELDEYIPELKKDDTRLRTLVPNDFSSPDAFEKSARRYRQAFCDCIGYPPPGGEATTWSVCYIPNKGRDNSCVNGNHQT